MFCFSCFYYLKFQLNNHIEIVYDYPSILESVYSN